MWFLETPSHFARENPSVNVIGFPLFLFIYSFFLNNIKYISIFEKHHIIMLNLVSYSFKGVTFTFTVGGWSDCLSQLYLRSLDNDLGNVMRAAEPFEWNRINFVLEAMRVMGKLKDSNNHWVE